MLGRASGVLLHPTSLPSRFAAGDLGPEAERFVDWLAEAGQGLWQVLPLGPTGPSGSPYTAASLFAGSPALISPRRLADDGLLDPGDVAAQAGAGDGERLLRRACRRAERQAGPLHESFEAFREAPEQRPWLDDWCLFAALRERFDGRPWWSWPAEVARRERPVLRAARRELAGEIRYHALVQHLFDGQWSALRRRAAGHGIRIVGDLPIYPALDSAEVWARRELFDVDRQGRPRAVAGVPPDAFSDDGQHWGHPLYCWPRHRDEGFAWWIDRLRVALRRADWLRVDHFRGYVAYWEVPRDAATARDGRWRPGPGRDLFAALERDLGPLPLVAEDLGHITDDVRALRRELGLPGMRVLQFGLGDPASEHLPHRFDASIAAYTGTHDNDTARGWLAAASPEARAFALDYLGGDGSAFHRDCLRAVWTSGAGWAIAPLQDLLGLDSRARMNTPGRSQSNWAWKLESGQLDEAGGGWLRRLTRVSGRLPAVSADADAASDGGAPGERAEGRAQAAPEAVQEGRG